MLTKVGKLLRQMRLNNNEILKDMSEKLGVSSAFLSAVENGKKKMPKDMKLKIIEKYSLSIDEIDNLDTAVLESNDSIEIDIKAVSDERKSLAVTFARSFGELSDEDIKYFSDYLKKREKEE